MISFIVDSDLHFTEKGIRYDKKNHVAKIIDLCKEGIDAVICPGDLTDHGWNGKKIFGWKYGGKEDEVSPLITEYIEPISKHTNIYLCKGNHDGYVPWPYLYKPVRNLVKRRHGDILYSFDIKSKRSDTDKVHFICLDIYPDKKALKFLSKDLAKNHLIPTVIFFHFNLAGPYSEWWRSDEKTAFYDRIKDHNIIAILVGHWHSNYVELWPQDASIKFPVISSGGSKLTVCTVENDGKISVKQV